MIFYIYLCRKFQITVDKQWSTVDFGCKVNAFFAYNQIFEYFFIYLIIKFYLVLVTFVIAQNYFVIFASLGIVRTSSTLLSLIAKINQKARAVLKKLKLLFTILLIIYNYDKKN